MAKKKFVIQKGTTVGTANIDAASGDFVTSGNIAATGNIVIGGSTTVGGAITANANVSIAGNTFGANIYQNGNQVLDTTSRVRTSVERADYSYTTPVIPTGQQHEFDIELGVSVIVYRLTVSRPCRVEIYGSADYSEANPYTFVATPDHLFDDGRVLMSDGSTFQSRQYSIFANLETPAVPKVYARISNIDNSTDPVTLSLVYFVGVAGIFS